MIRVLLVDDHDLVRMGVRRLLEDRSGQAGIEVIAEAASGEQAIEAAREHRPDVVLMDVDMPGMGGVEATRRLRAHWPAMKVLILTVHDDGPFPRWLLEAGASGYLTKGCHADEMALAIRRVMEGQRYLSPEIAQTLALSLLEKDESSPLDRLSQREHQILVMLTQGQSIQAISDALCLSPKTISTYKARMQEKLGVDGDAELFRLAVKLGLIRVDPEPG
ncbi:MAG: response regulator [Chromatiales bacterium]|jgi:two-component system invasion response regulator UvrY|nr:response regulator [Chromatiales bacterium]MDX9766168.1 response regulator [Ectothiorhodospiraceae bacterium]